jgi:uncharacterized protein (DUF488 family)
MRLLTIGYQGKPLDRLLTTLQEEGVDVLLDVRDVPWSRKPGFSKGQLSKALEAAGIRYRHVQELGTPAPLRRAFRESGDWQTIAAEYREYLGGQTEVLDQLVADHKEEKVCLLCFEADVNQCHRLAVAEALHARTAAEPEHL